MVETKPAPSVEKELNAFSLIVIVPAFNEGLSIGSTIKGIEAIRPQIEAFGGSLEIIVINDGSNDDTSARATEAGADSVVSHRANRGLGAAVHSGLTKAAKRGADIVVKIDADLQHDPTDIPRLIAPILSDQADIVFGSRHAKIEYQMPFVRRLGNRFFNGLMSYLTDWQIKDGQPGLIALNKAYVSNFYLPGRYNYTQQILLDARHRDLRFAQVDISFKPRKAGKSFVSVKYPFIAIYQILVVIATYAPLKVFGSLGLLCLAAAFMAMLVEMPLYIAGVTDKPVQNPNLVLGLLYLGLQSLLLSILAELVRGRN